MSFSDSLKGLIGIETVDDEEEDITKDEVKVEKEKLSESRPKRPQVPEPRMDRPQRPAPQPQAPQRPKPQPAARNFAVTQDTSAFKLVLIEPKSFDECPKLVDSLKARKPIIINLEKLESNLAHKIFDFLSGATYALNGNVQKVANNIFVFAPENVDIAGGQGVSDRTEFSYPNTDAKDPSDFHPWR